MLINDAKKYANNILDGKTIACETIKQACKRFLDNLNREDIYYDDVGKSSARCPRAPSRS